LRGRAVVAHIEEVLGRADERDVVEGLIGCGESGGKLAGTVLSIMTQRTSMKCRGDSGDVLRRSHTILHDNGGRQVMQQSVSTLTSRCETRCTIAGRILPSDSRSGGRRPITVAGLR